MKTFKTLLLLLILLTGTAVYATPVSLEKVGTYEFLRYPADWFGIGTTTPQANLDINMTTGAGLVPSARMGGNIGGDWDAFFGRFTNDDTLPGGDSFRIGNGTSTASTSMFVLDLGTGFLGLGTTTPTARLEVNGGGGAGTFGLTQTPSLVLGATGGTTAGAIKLWGTSNVAGIIQMTTNNLHLDSPTGTGVYLNNYNTTGFIDFLTQKFRMTTTGNLGIGTTTPTAKIDLYATAGCVGMPFRISSSTNVSMLELECNGNLGVGTTTAGFLLTVQGDTNQTGAMRFNGNAGTAGQILISNGSAVPTWTSTSTLGAGFNYLRLVSGGLQTATTTDFLRAAYFVATSTTATSTFPQAQIGTYVNKKFVFEGDSITTANGLTGATGNWPYLLSASSTFVGNGLLYNVASSSEKVSDMITQYPTQVRPYAKTSTTSESYFFIFGGLNDLANGSTTAQVYSSLKTEWALARADGFKVVAFTLLPNLFVLGARADLNDLILSDPTLYDYIVRPELVITDAASTTLISDGTHPTTYGNSLIAREVDNVLRGRLTPYAAPAINALQIGTTTMTGLQGAQLEVANYTRILGSANALSGVPKNGEGLEFTYDRTAGIGYLFSIDRTALVNKDFSIGSASNPLYIKGATGFVGINTTAPRERLQVNGAVTVTGAFATNSTSTGGMDFSGGNLEFASWGANTTTGGGFRFIGVNSDGTLSTSSMTILPSGDIGMGTVLPTARLHIDAGSITGTTVNPALKFSATYGSVNTVQSIDWNYIGNVASPVRIGAQFNAGGVGMELGFYTSTSYTTNGIERMKIDMNGNVGIGTTTPSAKLTVVGSSTITSLNAANCDVLADAVGGLYCGTNGGGGGTNFLSLLSGGVRTSTTTDFFQSAYFIASSTTATSTFGNATFGNVVASGAGTFNSITTSGLGVATIANLQIGNIVFPSVGGVLNGTSNFFWAAASSSLGIGSSTPQARLALVGNGGTQDILNVASSTNSSFLVVKASGNVGIGTTTPIRLLSVNGNAQFGSNTAVSTTTPLNVSFGGTFGSNTPGNVGNLKWDLYRNDADGNRYGIGMSGGLMEFQSGTSGGHAFFTNAGTRALDIVSSGNVGVGTTTPASKLHVYDSTAISTFTGNQSQGLTITGGDFSSSNHALIGFKSSTYGSSGNLAQIAAQFTSLGTLLKFGTSNNYASGITNTAMAITPAGEIGVGTTTPALAFPNSWGSSIGVGVESPTTAVVGVKSTLSTGYAFFDQTNNGNKSLLIGTYGSSFAGSNFGIPYANNSFFYSFPDSKLTVGTFGNAELTLGTNSAARMTITGAGLIGIGTTTPLSPLHVEGTQTTLDGMPVLQTLVSSSDTTKRMYFGYNSTFGGFTINSVHTGVAWQPVVFNNSAVRALGSVSQTPIGYSRLDLGVEAGTPRVVFEHGATGKVWLVDNDSGTFRFFTPSQLGMSLSKDGSNNTIEYLYDGSNNPIYTFDTAPTGYATIKGFRVSAHDTTNSIFLTTAWGMSSNGGADLIKFDGAGAITLSTASTERLKITSTGSIGIATSTPIGLFSVASTTGANLFTVARGGEVISGGTVPTTSSCGTNTIGGNNTAGTVNITAGAPSSCTVTFSGSAKTRPYAIVVTGRNNTTYYVSATSSTAFTVTGAATISGFSYMVMEY